MMRSLFAALALCALAAGAMADQVAQSRFDQGRQLRTGAQRDSVRAYALIHEAADRGHPAAMFILSGMLAEGEGTPVDAAASRHWLERAAALDYPEALQQLAMHLQQGAAGYPIDEARAAQLMRQVAHALTHRADGH